ncbi:hypothetical protein Hanom_Chr16g01423271 [Helianthus anomalus]
MKDSIQDEINRCSAATRIVSPKIKKVTPNIKKPTKIVLKKKPTQEPSKPPSPPPEPIPQQSPIHTITHHKNKPYSHLNKYSKHHHHHNHLFKPHLVLPGTKNVKTKVDVVLAENKRLADREKILEMRVKKVESGNKSLMKKIEADQTEIDILKVRVAELEEEKARRDEQNKYFELKLKNLKLLRR